MTHQYKTELIKEIMEARGHEKSSLHYESECIETWIDEMKGAYPKLCDYQSEWLNYIHENSIGEFPYETITTISTATVNNVVPLAYKSATLKGSTKYRDIDTGDILDTFDETKNIELVSVKVPVLTTSNEDGTESNILTVNEDVELRGIGELQDELNLLTGELTQRIAEVVLDGSETWAKNGSTTGYTMFRYIVPNLPTNTSMRVGCMLCDKFNVENYISTNAQTREFITIRNGTAGQLLLNVSNEKANEVAMLKEWLSQNPLTVQYQLATESIKTVELMITNQDGEIMSKIKPIEGTMNIEITGTPIVPTAILEIPVEAITQNLNSFIEEE